MNVRSKCGYAWHHLICVTVVILYFEDCSDGEIRLVGGTDFTQGRVEVCINRIWGTLCDQSFGSADAGVICDQLGYARHSKSLLYIQKCGLVVPSPPGYLQFYSFSLENWESLGDKVM